MSSIVNLQDSPYYLQFLDYLKEKFPDEYNEFTEKEIEDKFWNTFMMGLNKAREFLKTNKSCNLLFNGKPPRADMYKTLGYILYELQGIQSFPIVPPLRVTAAVEHTLAGKDKRTKNKHLTWIRTLCNFNNTFNKVDLSNIVNQYPHAMIVKKDLW